jgi:hypothetical protein
MIISLVTASIVYFEVKPYIMAKNSKQGFWKVGSG